MMSNFELSEEELRTLEGLVTNERAWSLLNKMVKTQVAILWTSLRGTDIADEARVVANHRLAVGVEAALTDMLKAMEDTVRLRQYMVTEPQVIDDSTKSLYQ